MYELSISFFIRGKRPNPKGQVPIYCRITIDGVFTNLATRRWVTPAKWSAHKERVKGNSEDSKEINHHLTMMENKIYTIHTRFVNEGRAVTAELLKKELTDQRDKRTMVSHMFHKHNRQIYKRIGYDMVYSTWQRYDATYRHVQEYIQHQYKRKDMVLAELNKPFIRDFETFLKTVKQLKHNSSVKYIRNLRKVVKWAVENEWLHKDPFYGFTRPWKEEECVFLDEMELQTIEEVEIANQRIAEARDVFVFGCYTGIAYCDLKALRKDDLYTDKEGYQWINMRRMKTDSRATVYLLPKARAVINKYKDDPACKQNNALLPVRSNQKYNDALKDLGEMCELDKTLTTHVARHTCATLLLNRDVPIETVSSMLGHKNIQQTQHYAKLLNRKVKKDMVELEMRMG